MAEETFNSEIGFIVVFVTSIWSSSNLHQGKSEPLTINRALYPEVEKLILMRWVRKISYAGCTRTLELLVQTLVRTLIRQVVFCVLSATFA